MAWNTPIFLTDQSTDNAAQVTGHAFAETAHRSTPGAAIEVLITQPVERFIDSAPVRYAGNIGYVIT